jgi:hypothetical protein
MSWPAAVVCAMALVGFAASTEAPAHEHGVVWAQSPEYGRMRV